MKNIIIDTDPGKDDFLAILLLILSNRLNIKALTTVMGNSSLENVTSNARYILDITKSKVPLYAGANTPLTRPFRSGQVMGKSGLDGIEVKQINIAANQASLKINEICQNSSTIILALGPLTNIAKALKYFPDLESKIEKLVIMGGAINCVGNTNDYAEFNINSDPEAADIIFRSKIPKIVIPLDLCYEVPLYLSDFKKINNSKYKDIILSIMKPYIKALQKYENQKGAIVYDALAAYYLINPKAFTLTPMSISIEIKNKNKLGQCIVDINQSPNTFIATNITKNQFKQDFIDILNKG